MQVGGGGGGVGKVEFLTEKKISLRNVPGVLKRKKKKFLGFCNACKQKFIFRGGGGDFGVFGAPHAPTRGSRGVGKQYTSSYDHDM